MLRRYMKRLISLALALIVMIMCTIPAVCAASADEATHPAPELDSNFNVDLATALIIIFCSVIGAAILVFSVVMSKRNFHN